MDGYFCLNNLLLWVCSFVDNLLLYEFVYKLSLLNTKGPNSLK